MSGPTRTRKVPPELPRDPRWRALSDLGRALLYYILVGPQTDSVPGLNAFSVALAAEDLDRTTRAVEKQLAIITTAGLITVWDRAARVIWNAKSIEWAPPRNAAVNVASWAYAWNAVPDGAAKCAARERLFAYFATRGPEFVAAFEKFAGPQGAPSGSTVRAGPESVTASATPFRTYTDHDHDHDHDHEGDRDRASRRPPPSTQDPKNNTRGSTSTKRGVFAAVDPSTLTPRARSVFDALLARGELFVGVDPWVIAGAARQMDARASSHKRLDGKPLDAELADALSGGAKLLAQFADATSEGILVKVEQVFRWRVDTAAKDDANPPRRSKPFNAPAESAGGIDVEFELAEMARPFGRSSARRGEGPAQVGAVMASLARTTATAVPPDDLAVQHVRKESVR